MRDVGLAKRQFYGGIVLLLLALALLWGILLPQYQQYKAGNVLPQLPSELTKQLQVLDGYHNQRDTRQVETIITTDIEGCNTVLVKLLIDSKGLKPLSKGALSIQQLPLKLVVKGSYSAIRKLMEQLHYHFPTWYVTHFHLQNVETVTLLPGESPILQAEVDATLLVMTP